MIKMIATDIDGTILNWNGEFSPKVIKCIQNLTENGIKVVLVTGRMHSSTTPIAKKLGLDTPVVSYQGGLVKDMNNNTLYQKDLPVNLAKEIIKWAKENNIHINLYIDDKLYVEKDCESIQRYIKGKFVDYTVCSFDKLEIKDVNKILAIDYNDADKVTGWVKELSKKYPDLYIVNSVFLRNRFKRC